MRRASRISGQHTCFVFQWHRVRILAYPDWHFSWTRSVLLRKCRSTLNTSRPLPSTFLSVHTSRSSCHSTSYSVYFTAQPWSELMHYGWARGGAHDSSDSARLKKRTHCIIYAFEKVIKQAMNQSRSTLFPVPHKSPACPSYTRYTVYVTPQPNTPCSRPIWTEWHQLTCVLLSPDKTLLQILVVFPTDNTPVENVLEKRMWVCK
jgi:hypothetical protein